jgi:Flp pilus assembly protein TadB
MITVYFIIGALIVLTVSHTAFFLWGFSHARKNAEAERQEEERRRLQSERELQKEKENIMQEVFDDAEEKKASLSSGTGRDNFNAINDSLRERPKN